MTDKKLSSPLMGEDEGEGDGFFWLPPFLTPPNPLNPPYQGDVPYKSPSP